MTGCFLLVVLYNDNLGTFSNHHDYTMKKAICILLLLAQLYLLCSSYMLFGINNKNIVKRNGNREEYCKEKVNITEQCFNLTETVVRLKLTALTLDTSISGRLSNFRESATNSLNNYCMTNCLDSTLEFLQCLLNDSSPIIIQLVLEVFSNVTCSQVNGTYCIVQIYETQKSGELQPVIQTVAICNGSVGICRENCSTNLQRAKASLGCCLETFLSNIMSFLENVPASNDLPRIIIDYPTCGVQLSGQCPTSIPTEAPKIPNDTTIATSMQKIILYIIILTSYIIGSVILLIGCCLLFELLNIF